MHENYQIIFKWCSTVTKLLTETLIEDNQAVVWQIWLWKRYRRKSIFQHSRLMKSSPLFWTNFKLKLEKNSACRFWLFRIMKVPMPETSEKFCYWITFFKSVIVDRHHNARIAAGCFGVLQVWTFRATCLLCFLWPLWSMKIAMQKTLPQIKFLMCFQQL